MHNDLSDNTDFDDADRYTHGGLIDKLILLIGLILEGNVLNLSEAQLTGLIAVASVLRSPDGRLHIDNLIATVNNEEEDIYDRAL